MYVITTLVMVLNISKTGDKTHDASFHATVSIMLLIHVLIMAARSQKHKIRHFSINTIMTSDKLTHKSYKTASILTVQNKYLWKNIRLLSLTHDHSHETVVEPCSIKHFTLQTLHYIAK